MAEWTVCSQCHLKHTRRPDGACPRCRHASAAPADTVAPTAVPAVAEPEPPAPSGGMPQIYDGRPVARERVFEEPTHVSGDMPLGPRLAGAVLLLNAAAVGLERFALQGGEGGLGKAAPVSMLFDVVIGGLLVAGDERPLVWAKVRAVLGGLVLPVLHVFAGNSFMAALQVFFSVGILMLLVGHAGKVRIALAGTALGGCLALEGVGLVALSSGHNPLGRLMMAGQLEASQAATFEGAKAPYRLTAASGWYLRRAEAVRKDNELADRWIVRPASDAHMVVIAERVDALPGQVDMERFGDVVLDNARKAAPNLQVVSRRPLPHALPALLLHTRGTLEGLPVEHYMALYVHEPWIFQVIAFAHQRHFAKIESELLAILSSFQSTVS